MTKKKVGWEREFRFYYSAPLVDLCNKEKPTLKDINEILVKQINFIRQLLAQELRGLRMEERKGEKEIGLDNKSSEDYTAYHIWEESGLPISYWDVVPERVWTTIYNRAVSEINETINQRLKEVR